MAEASMRLDEIVFFGFGSVLAVLIWIGMKVIKALHRIDDRLREDIAAQSRPFSDGEPIIGKILKKMDNIESELKWFDDQKLGGKLLNAIRDLGELRNAIGDLGKGLDRLGDGGFSKILDAVANLKEELDVDGASEHYTDHRGHKGTDHVTTFGESIYKKMESVLTELKNITDILRKE
jgi:hypothetical protein